MSEDELYPIAVLIDELKNEDVQVRATHTHTHAYVHAYTRTYLTYFEKISWQERPEVATQCPYLFTEQCWVDTRPLRKKCVVDSVYG